MKVEGGPKTVSGIPDKGVVFLQTPTHVSEPTTGRFIPAGNVAVKHGRPPSSRWVMWAPHLRLDWTDWGGTVSVAGHCTIGFVSQAYSLRSV